MKGDTHSSVARVVLVVYLAVAVADLVAVGLPVGGLEWVAKPLLMPLLAVYLLLRLGPTGRCWPVVLSLAVACAGDIALLFDSTTAFLVGMVLFAGTHLTYVITFLIRGAAGGLRRRWWVPVLYALAWIAGVVLVATRAPATRTVEFAVYGLILFAMGTTAAGLDGLLGLGAVLFVVSDLLIGARAVDVTLPAPAGDLVIMGLYIAGQAAIVVRYGTLSRAGAPVSARRASAGTR